MRFIRPRFWRRGPIERVYFGPVWFDRAGCHRIPDRGIDVSDDEVVMIEVGIRRLGGVSLACPWPEAWPSIRAHFLRAEADKGRRIARKMARAALWRRWWIFRQRLGLRVRWAAASAWRRIWEWLPGSG